MDTIIDRIEAVHAHRGSIRLAIHRLATERGLIASDTVAEVTATPKASQPTSSPAAQSRAAKPAAAYVPPQAKVEASLEERIRAARAKAYADGFAEANALCIERANKLAADAAKQRDADAFWDRVIAAVWPNRQANTKVPKRTASSDVWDQAIAKVYGRYG